MSTVLDNLVMVSLCSYHASPSTGIFHSLEDFFLQLLHRQKFFATDTVEEIIFQKSKLLELAN